MMMMMEVETGARETSETGKWLRVVDEREGEGLERW